MTAGAVSWKPGFFRDHTWPQMSIMAIMLVVVGVMTLYPLGMIIFGSLRSSMPGEPGYFTLDGYRQFLSDPGILMALWNSFAIAGVRTLISMILAVFFCWVIVRTDTPLKGPLEFMLWLNFFLPALPMTMGWILLLDPHYGFINKLFLKLPFLKESPFNIYSYSGIIWSHMAFSTSVRFLMFTPAFRNMDAALEESARMSGASNLKTLVRITFPLMIPAVLATTMLGFIRAMESFEIELLLGMPAKIFVYATKVFDLLRWEPPQYPPAMALSTIFMVIIFFMVFIQHRVTKRRQYTTITGKGYRVNPTSLGRWKYVTLGICLLYIAIFTLLPLTFLVIGTFMKIAGMFELPDPFTLHHWQTILGDPLFFRSLINSMLMACGAAFVGMIFYSIISYITIRTKLPGRGLLGFMSWLPWSVPGLLLAVGLLWVFLGNPILVPLYGTLYVLIIAMIIKEMSMGVRVMDGSMIQIGNELEEAARSSGASWFYTFRHIIAPLLRPTFLATAVLIFLISIREISVVVMLYSAKCKVLSILMLEYYQGRSPEEGMAMGLIIVFIALIVAAVMRFIFGMRLATR
ncbi:ABC transporter permease [Thermodesulfobacteriota bacterium]